MHVCVCMCVCACVCVYLVGMQVSLLLIKMLIICYMQNGINKFLSDPYPGSVHFI